ncbi:tRNA (cytidine(34)-2'-O)-methyltransferase [Candidatus Syntrophocurvum alkaliphilum]|uniref:Putative tRNA (cytidine(34)-2'-O)-methyltransferase n=1 Tax=Candidatus Syntrophocurvum alkaliphilum TaxID=2293317 RepID=A0A6I6DE91_9FIRM|nr:tRNA (cytidine(34)-2'-O)-methyltransferase [Candidatus Syntrophocurvum alkaliphilum]QGU00875.1 tRNA (cytidine(34)-2'-O)-methyltransferase [Candidatus Syntrophocurvum alkaliphilum]
MHIVLISPEIPQNTGNIARTCALTNTSLHLVKPLGFSIEDRYLKRAGLDYWDKLDIKVWENFEEIAKKYTKHNFYLATTKAQKKYTDIRYKKNDLLVFGSETSGIKKEILKTLPDNQIRIPMLKIGRSLNLGNSVSIVLYEALRQLDFPGLE